MTVYLCVVWNSLHRPGWSETQSLLSLPPNAGIKGVRHHHPASLNFNFKTLLQLHVHIQTLSQQHFYITAFYLLLIQQTQPHFTSLEIECTNSHVITEQIASFLNKNSSLEFNRQGLKSQECSSGHPAMKTCLFSRKHLELGSLSTGSVHSFVNPNMVLYHGPVVGTSDESSF